MRQRGQVALIALLVLTIATTVGLSLVARTTTDVSVTRTIEESSRAFSAAEAGIEETLKSGVASAGTIDSALGIKYTATPVTVAGSIGNPFIFPQKTLKAQTETVWLVDHLATGAIVEVPTYTANTIDVCWSDESPKPALVVSVVYKKLGGSYQVAKTVYDPDSRIPNVSPASAGGCTTNTAYTGTINFSALGIDSVNDTIIELRIRPVYNGAQLAIAPAQNLPVQETRIQSVGETGSGVTRKIIVYQQYWAPASIFDHAVYSEGSGGNFLQ